MLCVMDRATAEDDPLDAPRVTPEQLLASMPPRVREAFPDPAVFPLFGWTEETLWQLDRPVEEVPIDVFDWLLEVPIWRWQGRRFQLSLRDVLRHPDQYQAHYEKAERADTRYPIHITRSKRRWIILDGYHRLLKTLVRGESTIKVMKVRAEDLAGSTEEPAAKTKT